MSGGREVIASPAPGPNTGTEHESRTSAVRAFMVGAQVERVNPLRDIHPEGVSIPGSSFLRERSD